MNSLVWAEISLSALENNLSVAKQSASSSKVMAVIKSDAYGHGAVESAKALNAADVMAVARIDEAINLRNNNILHDIIVLSGLCTEQDLQTCIDQQLQPVIHSENSLRLLSGFHAPSTLKVWLKVDTGMHRIGLNPDNFDKSFKSVGNARNIELQGVLSHLSDAENVADKKNTEQFELFNKLCHEIPVNSRSLCNSAGILFHQQMHFEWVRPGIMLYGVNPSKTENIFTKQLKPVMTLKSRVINIKPVQPGEKVGYNGTWVARKPCMIATIAIGYGDGYPRHAQNGTPVLINGKTYPLSGRVSMDMITIDVGDDDIKIGDEVTLWGEGLPAELIADHAETIAYDLFCGVTARVPRIYL